MSLLEQYRAFARYNRWMNQKLFAAAVSLDDAERKRDRSAFFGSIHGTLNHLLLADRIWLSRFTGGDGRTIPYDAHGGEIAVTSLAQILYEDFDVLRRERGRTDDDLLAWVYALDEAAVDGMLEYRTLRGDRGHNPLWWSLGHLFNHQTHHRGQITTLLSQAGVDVGSTDLVHMLRDESAAAG